MSEVLQLIETPPGAETLGVDVVTQEVGALAVTHFDPEVDELGSVDMSTLGDRGWQRDGARYERGD